MFEQAVLESTYSGRRAFATGIGFAFQVLLAVSLILTPLMWPPILPVAQFSMTVGRPPLSPKPEDHTIALKPHASRTPAPAFRTDLLIPQHMPSHPRIISDPLADAAPVGVAPGGLSIGEQGANPIISELLNAIPGPAPLEKPKPAQSAATEEPKRIRASSLDPAKIIYKVQPEYPQIARTARIEGTVELLAVVGVDGQVRDLKVLSGHPLLRKAAMDAVSRWLYQPPVLNGEKWRLWRPSRWSSSWGSREFHRRNAKSVAKPFVLSAPSDSSEMFREWVNKERHCGRGARELRGSKGHWRWKRQSRTEPVAPTSSQRPLAWTRAASGTSRTPPSIRADLDFPAQPRQNYRL